MSRLLVALFLMIALFTSMISAQDKDDANRRSGLTFPSLDVTLYISNAVFFLPDITLNHSWSNSSSFSRAALRITRNGQCRVPTPHSGLERNALFACHSSIPTAGIVLIVTPQSGGSNSTTNSHAEASAWEFNIHLPTASAHSTMCVHDTRTPNWASPKPTRYLQ